jgi:hypothetical protein
MPYASAWHVSPEHSVALGGVRKAQTAEEIATECGSLGVYEVPEGFDPTKVYLLFFPFCDPPSIL